MKQRVPTLPTPTTLRAASTKRKPRMSSWRSADSDDRYDSIRSLVWPRMAGSWMRSTTGGFSISSSSPSTRWASFSKACWLVLARALAMMRSAASTSGVGYGRGLGLVEIGALVPQVEHQHLGVAGHGRAVGASDGGGRGHRLGLTEAVGPRRHHHAGGQALHVPLPGPGQRLVEVVDVEHQVAIRGRVHAEVHQVGVAADLHVDAAGDRAGQVAGHHVGRPAVVGEGRGQHPTPTDGDQLGHPVAVGPLQQLDAGRPDRRAASSRRGPGAASSGATCGRARRASRGSSSG